MVMMATLMVKTSLDNCTCGGAPPSLSWNAPQGLRCARGAFNFEAWWLEFVMIKPVGGPNSSDLVKDIDARPLCEANHQVVVVSLKKPSSSAYGVITDISIQPTAYISIRICSTSNRWGTTIRSGKISLAT